VPGTFSSPIKVSLDFPGGDTKPCPLFVGRYFRGLKNGPSPEWLKRRLKAIGLRPISALVDITNYITFSHGRPLHVFDAAKVTGNIRARMAKDGETIAALDGKTYELTSEMTVIADDEHAEAIAGIIGGEASGCSEATTEVFLEAAYFDPLRTAATGRKLGIVSDARYRFERGVDPDFTQTGAEIATHLILDLCGGEASHLIIAGVVPDTARSYAQRLAGEGAGRADIPLAEQVGILADLGFGVKETKDGLSCAVPSWRPDVHSEIDLVRKSAASMASTIFLRRHGPGSCNRPAGAQCLAEAHAGGAAHAGRARLQRGGHLVLHSRSAGQAVRRRPAGAEARQSHLLGTDRHAAFAAAQSDCRGRPQHGAGFCRPGAQRNGPCLCRRPAAGRNLAGRWHPSWAGGCA
jgi:hypothetical protein